MNAQELEKLRKKYAVIVLIAFFAWIAAVVLSIANFDTWGLSFSTLKIGWLTGLFIVYVLFAKLRKKYATQYKETFARKILEETFKDLTFNPDAGISEAEFEANGIFCDWDIYSSSNFVSGKYKGVSFEYSDIRTENESTTRTSHFGSHTNYTPVFCGRWLVFDYNKSFRSSVKVLEKYFGDSFVYRSSSSEYEKISMENQTFNDKFHTLSTSEQDAFYLLTPQVMETLLKLEEAEKEHIVFFFNGNRLQIGLNNSKEAFSPGTLGIFKKINEEKTHENMVKDIQIILEFADSLQLNNDLFKAGSSDN